jgi:hypothetical protein
MESPTSKLFKNRALKYKMLSEAEPHHAGGYRKLVSAYEVLVERSDRQEQLLNKAREAVTK